MDSELITVQSNAAHEAWRVFSLTAEVNGFASLNVLGWSYASEHFAESMEFGDDKIAETTTVKR